MKNTIATIITSFIATTTLCAQDVSTAIENKNVLLEEFTAIHCGYCPQGHAIGNRLKSAQPDNVYVIAIHSGNLAEPGLDEPDYRTTYGSMLDAEFEVSGYPSGTVNRHAFNNRLLSNRSEWASYTKELRQETAIVNLLAKSEYDGNTRRLTVHVEGYYTDNSKKEQNKLNVVLTQNNIQGPQAGGGVGNEYIHQHMLRDYITTDWGDVIDNTHKGEYFARTYTYTVPEQINGVEVKPEDIEIIAFVCEDKTEVLNVTGTKPIYKNYDRPLAAVLENTNMPIKNTYGFDFFDLFVTNQSNEPIKEIDFSVTVNSEKKEIKWTGEIAGFHREAIRIEAFPYQLQEQNSYTIETTAINGVKYQSEKASISGRFKSPTPITSQIKIQIKTDLYATENIFALKDKSGNIVKSFGPYPSGVIKEYNETAELQENEIYCFEALDIWGDGIQQPKGYYKILDYADNVKIENQQIESFGSRSFFITSLTSNIDKPAKKADSWNMVQTDNSILLTFADARMRKVQIFTFDGKYCLEQTIHEKSHSIPAGTFRKGLYLVVVSDNNNRTIQKLVVN